MDSRPPTRPASSCEWEAEPGYHVLIDSLVLLFTMRVSGLPGGEIKTRFQTLSKSMEKRTTLPGNCIYSSYEALNPAQPVSPSTQTMI